MADLYDVATGEVALADDVNQYKDALQGGSEQQFSFKQKAGANFGIQMATANGTDKVSFKDSAQVEVAYVNSDGEASFSDITLNGQPVFTYPRELARNTTGATTTATAATDLLTVSTDVFGDALSIPADRWAEISVDYSKDATAAQAVAIGLKLNSTTVVEAVVGTSPSSSATQRAEAGFAKFIVPPRSSVSYGMGVQFPYSCYTTAGATAASGTGIGVSATAVPPQAAITSITIRGINGTASNNLAIKNVTVVVY